MEAWNKLLSGDLNNTAKKGIMIIGPNTFDGDIFTWHCDNEEQAVKLSTHFSEISGCCYEILKYELIGVVRPAKLPTEFINLTPQP